MTSSRRILAISNYRVPLPQGEEHLSPDVHQILGHPGLFEGGVVSADSTPDLFGLMTGIWDSSQTPLLSLIKKIPVYFKIKIIRK